MELIKKHLIFVISSLVLLLVFLITRLYGLMSLPIFTDEAIYTRWAQIARFDSNWRFISLTDGKQPSFVWAQIIFMKIFDDPLFAGRMVSVLSGLVVVIGIAFLTYEIFKKEEGKRAMTIALVASALAVFFPFLLVYDRIAIYESMTAAFFVWSLYFQILLVRRMRLDLAMILGFILGGAVLTKTSGFLSIYFSPLLLFLFDFKKKELRNRRSKFIIFTIVAVVIAYTMYSIQRLSPFFHIIQEKNSVFVYPVSEWMKFQFMDKIGNFISNFKGLFDWFLVYFTIPYIALTLYSFAKRQFIKEKIMLALWFLLPFLALSVFGKTLYPRYILFMVLPLIPLVAYSIYHLLSKFKNLFLKVALVLLIGVIPLRMDYYILFDFANAPIPKLDLEQFINGWPAGGGVKESVEFFSEKSKEGPIYVATQGTFGLMPASYEISFINNKKITTKGYWPTNETVPEEVMEISKTMPTYFVFYQDCALCEFPGDAPDSWNIKKVASYNKGIGNTRLTIYQVIPE